MRLWDASGEWKNGKTSPHGVRISHFCPLKARAFLNIDDSAAALIYRISAVVLSRWTAFRQIFTFPKNVCKKISVAATLDSSKLELTTVGLYCCHKMSPNILTISNERPYLIETLTEPLKYHSHCSRTGTRFLSSSVATIWQNWNVEAHCSTSVCCGRSNCRWSNFSILLLFKWAVSNQWVSRAVYSVSITSTWSACVTDSSLNTTAHHFLSVLSYVFLSSSVLVIDVSVYMTLFSLHHFILTYQQSFKQMLFFLLRGRLQLVILPKLHPAADRISMIWSSGFVTS